MWRISAVEQWPESAPLPWRLAIEVGPRIEGTGGIEIQSGAVARSFFDATAPVDLTAATRWLAGDEATALLDAVADGFSCEMLWTGDLSVSWSEAAWQAGHALIVRVG